MSSNSEHVDLITFDEESRGSRSTNPFSADGYDSSNSSLIDMPIGEGATAVNVPPQNGDGETDFNRKLDKLINCLSKMATDKSDSGHKDIRHIDTFSGEGSELVVVSKLKTFVRDFDEFFYGRTLMERDKIALVRQKLSGAAKSFINTSLPYTYADLRHMLFDTFSNIHMSQEDLLSELRNTKMRDNETFRQYSIRTLDLANVVAFKLEGNVNDKIVFEALSKALLSKFQSYVHIQAQVMRALKDRSPYALIKELCELIETDNSVLIKNEKKLGSKAGNKSVNYMSGSNDVRNIVCGHCFRVGHVVKDCYFLKNMTSYRNQDQNFQWGRRT